LKTKIFYSTLKNVLAFYNAGVVAANASKFGARHRERVMKISGEEPEPEGAQHEPARHDLGALLRLLRRSGVEKE
jgi:hypothetical protein